MRILHLITGLNAGGAERALDNLLLGGLASYATNQIVSLGTKGEFGPKIESLGVPVNALDLRGYQIAPTAITQLMLLVRRMQPDIIQGWMYHGNLAAVLARLLSPGSPPLIWQIRHALNDIGTDKWSTRRVIQVGKMLSRRPSCILYNSQMSRDQHESYGYFAGRSEVISNGIDTKRWKIDEEARSRVRSVLGIPVGSRVVGFVGRYHPTKDVPLFLEAVAPIMRMHRDVHSIVVGMGTGPENSFLAPFISALPRDRVHCLGYRDDIPGLMPAMDTLCLTSRSESMPNVLGEAMACGVPCVTTDVGDSRLIVGDTGLIVPVSDVQALSAAIMRLLSIPESSLRELGATARDRIKTQFSLATAVSRYQELYERLLREHGVCAV